MLDTVLEEPTSEPIPEPKPAPEPQPPLDSGDWVWVIYWRPFALPGQPNNGSWESAMTRIVAVGKTKICHEVSNHGAAPDDASVQGSLLRWTDSARVFRDHATAAEACRTLPAPV